MRASLRLQLATVKTKRSPPGRVDGGQGTRCGTPFAFSWVHKGGDDRRERRHPRLAAARPIGRADLHERRSAGLPRPRPRLQNRPGGGRNGQGSDRRRPPVGGPIHEGGGSGPSTGRRRRGRSDAGGSAGADRRRDASRLHPLRSGPPRLRRPRRRRAAAPARTERGHRSRHRGDQPGSDARLLPAGRQGLPDEEHGRRGVHGSAAQALRQRVLLSARGGRSVARPVDASTDAARSGSAARAGDRQGQQATGADAEYLGEHVQDLSAQHLREARCQDAGGSGAQGEELGVVDTRRRR